MKWIIQSNLINIKDHNKIKEVCIKKAYDYESIVIIPFTNNIPNIKTDQLTIFYGSTDFINNIYLSKKWKPGTFYNENFTVKAYNKHYKENMMNYSCQFTTIGEFASSHQPADKLFFIRPIKDLKEFAGDVMEFNNILRWERNIGCDNNPTLSINTEIAVSEPYGIAHEWRLFIVNGKVSSGSHYRSYMKLDSKEDLPQNVIDFVESMCKMWTPSDIFVMDVGESNNKLYIIECNCFNSSGFYKSNVEKIIIDVSEYTKYQTGDNMEDDENVEDDCSNLDEFDSIDKDLEIDEINVSDDTVQFFEKECKEDSKLEIEDENEENW